MIVLLLRMILSWFPDAARPGSAVASVYVVIRDLTEPVLGPLRRVIPPAGMFDLSVLVLWIFLLILRGIVC